MVRGTKAWTAVSVADAKIEPEGGNAEGKIAASTIARAPDSERSYTDMPQTAEEKRSSFEREAIPHLDTLYRMALRFTREPARAQDLVQDTMLKAYRSWHRYEPGTNVRAWLLTILR